MCIRDSVKADLAGSTKDYQDGFVKKIQESMARIKGSREMEERFMLLEELLRDCLLYTSRCV